MEQNNIWIIGRTVKGKLYYYNTITKKSQWNYPGTKDVNNNDTCYTCGNKLETINKTKNIQYNVTPKSKDLTHYPKYECNTPNTEWILGRTVGGKPYYYNTKTKRSQFELPITNLNYVFISNDNT